MPGYVMHLACAKRIIELQEIRNPQEQRRLLVGSILPDMHGNSDSRSSEKDYKRKTHYWSEEVYQCFDRYPDLDLFLDKFGMAIYRSEQMDSFLLGYYSHLLLDYLLIDVYWKKHFLLTDKNRKMDNRFEQVAWIYERTKEQWLTREELFSDKMYYGDYDRCFSYFVQRYGLKDFQSLHMVEFLDQIKAEDFPMDDIDILQSIDEMKEIFRRIEECECYKDRFLEPPLNILNLSELVSLTESAAKEIARR